MKKGFTLIELLVVVSIIGILAGFVVANFANPQSRARDAQRKNDLNQLQKALEMYKNDQSTMQYPAALSSLASTYIKAVPKDPSTNTDYGYTMPRVAGNNLTYKLVACFENANDAARDSTKDSSCATAPQNVASYTKTESQ